MIRALVVMCPNLRFAVTDREGASRGFSYLADAKKLIYLSIFLCFKLIAPISGILVAYLWVILEIFILFLIAVKKPRYTFPATLCIIGSSLEFSAYVFQNSSVNQLVSIVTVLKPLGLFILLLIAYAVSTANNSIQKIKKFPASSATIWFNLVLASLILAPVVTVVQMIVNIFPNQLLTNPYHLATILFSQYYPAFVFVLSCLYVSHDKHNMYILAQSIFRLSVAIGISGLIVNTLGFHGWYGESPYYLSPLWQFMLPFFILLEPIIPLYSKKRLLLLWFVSCTVLPIFLLNLHGGKFILFPLLAGALVLSLYVTKKYSYRSILVPLLISALILLPVLASFQPESALLNSKTNEVFSLFSSISLSDISLLEPSSAFRAAELLNIFSHYANNPIYLIFGFGSLGWIYDYLGLFPFDLTGGFPDFESHVGIYLSLHEGTSLILRHGLLGLLIILGALMLILDSNIRRNNPFLVIGLIWFVFFWGYSMTLPVLGAPALCIGLYKAEI